jgi:hypothetical protein
VSRPNISVNGRWYADTLKPFCDRAQVSVKSFVAWLVRDVTGEDAALKRPPPVRRRR